MPEAVATGAGRLPGQMSTNPAAVLFAAVNAIKELAVRLDALEAARA